MQDTQNTRTRNHPMKLVDSGQTQRISYLLKFIINLWKSLPQAMIMVTGTDNFKRGIDNFINIKFISGHLP